MTWWQGCGTATKVAEFDGAGTLQTIGLVSSTLGSYDALSLAYNPVSMTFALVGIERVDDHAMATELNSRGYRISGEIRVETDAQYVPIRYPRVTSHASDKTWLVALDMSSFIRTGSQILATSSSDGGGPGSYPPPGACGYSVNPTSGTEPATGGTGSFSVTTTAGCAWTATTAASWVHITSGTSGSGSGSVIFTVDANPGASRSATITAGDQTYTVNQTGQTVGCAYSISPTSGTEPAAGGTGSFAVTTTDGCAWTAATAASWVHITAGTSGTGSGTVSYSADANVGPARSATITAGGQAYTVNQPGNCSYVFDPSSSGAIASSGATGMTFTVITTSGCSWTASTTDNWVHVTSGSGSASGTVTYSVDANSGIARTGTISLGGQTFTVTQDALVLPPGCTQVTVLAKPTPPPGAGGLETLWQSSGVFLTAGQPVTLAAFGNWSDAGVTLTAAGHPTTTVTGTNCPLSGARLLALIGRVGLNGAPFLVGPTTTFTPSSGGILYLAPQDNWYTTWDNVGSLTVSVCIALGGSCGYSLNPSGSAIAAGGGSGSFTVTTETGCSWTAATSASWIHVTSGSGTSSGAVAFTVDPNTGAGRTGTITVDNQTYTVTQAEAVATSCTTAAVQAKPTPPPGVGGVETLWQSTGITVTAGQLLTVTATGTWSNGGVAISPAGDPSTIVEGTNCPLPGQPLLALIGRIGPTGAPFLIGAAKTWAPTTSGTLYLAPQDNWYLTWDNAGSLGVSVCQDASGTCSFVLNPTSSAMVASGGGSGSFAVTTGSSCAWTPVAASPWIHVTSGGGPGSATVTYTVDVNPGSPRTGSITVGDKSHLVSQSGDTATTCTTVTVVAKPTPPSGVGGVETLWQTTGVTLTAGQPVAITASGNWTDAGVSLTAAGHPTATVTGPNCPLSGAPLLGLIGRIGPAGTPFLIGASTAWTPSTSGVLYLAPQDNWYTTWDNAGSLSVSICLDAGGGGCSYSLAPESSGTIASGGGSGAFTVTTSTGCAWTAATTDSWIHVTSGSGPSSGTVSYAVDVNTGPARTGAITAGGQTFTITQAADQSQVCDTVTVLAAPVVPPGAGGVEPMWLSTGVLLAVGRPVTVTAAGTWSNAGVTLTADGHPTVTVTGTNCALSGQPLLALIGRVGLTGAPFLLGANRTFTPTTNGVLYLVPQDNWYTTWDNTGSLSVTICR